jgi:hypothetical protein
VWQTLKAWWQQPFNASASATQWVLFTGLILVAIFLWTRILREAGHVIEKV